jgi:hypothetical protein
MRTERIVLGIFLAATVSVARAEWRLDAETGVVYDSNLSKSDRESDQQADVAWRTNISLAQGLQLTRDLRANVAADLRGNVQGEYDAFNEIGAGVVANLRYRFGLGHTAPWILLENRFGYDRFHETERSGWDELIGFRGGIAVTERVALEAGYAFENVAVPDNFFDAQSHRADFRVIADVTSSLQIALGYTYREGDVISYAVPPRPEIAAIAVEREEVTTFGTNPLYTAYKLPGRTHALSVSVAYVLTKHASVQVGYEYAVTSHDPLRYENHIVEAKMAISY